MMRHRSLFPISNLQCSNSHAPSVMKTNRLLSMRFKKERKRKEALTVKRKGKRGIRMREEITKERAGKRRRKRKRKSGLAVKEIFWMFTTPRDILMKSTLHSTCLLSYHYFSLLSSFHSFSSSTSNELSSPPFYPPPSPPAHLILSLIDGWALTDSLSSFVSRLTRQNEEATRYVCQWSRSENIWKVRAASVSFVTNARHAQKNGEPFPVSFSLSSLLSPCFYFLFLPSVSSSSPGFPSHTHEGFLWSPLWDRRVLSRLLFPFHWALRPTWLRVVIARDISLRKEESYLLHWEAPREFLAWGITVCDWEDDGKWEEEIDELQKGEWEWESEEESEW